MPLADSGPLPYHSYSQNLPRIMSKTLRAFTLVELLVAVAVIAILAAIGLNIAGHIQNKAARSRTQVELKALELGMENHKIDNGTVPIAQNGNPTANGSPTANFALYKLLVPDNGAPYVDFRRDQLEITSTATNIVDPFGGYWGYVARPTAGKPAGVMGGEYDLWSTAGSPNTPEQWINNW